LDDFLIIHPGQQSPEIYSKHFQVLAAAVGLSIKESKNEQGKVVCFAGLELDTEQMVVRLPRSKLEKSRRTIEDPTKATSISLLELQKITGFLNFLGIITPLGRAFLRRLYNMQLFCPAHSRHYRRQISSEARKDLNWWHRLLAVGPERSIRT